MEMPTPPEALHANSAGEPPRNPDNQQQQQINRQIRSQDQEQQQHREQRQKQEKVSRERDQQTAQRLVESPDLREALESLQPQLRIMKRYLDGTLHAERARQAQNRIVMIPEFQRELDALNKQIADLRNTQGLQFRAVDVWAALNEMPITPGAISLKFPPAPQGLSDDYLDNRIGGALCWIQPMHLQIDADRFTIINDDAPGAASSAPAFLDTSLFLLRVHGLTPDRKLLGEDLSEFLGSSRVDTASLRETLVQRARSYGCRVGIDGDPDSGDVVNIYIDLSSGFQGTGASGRYLYIRALKYARNWHIDETSCVTNEPPRSRVVME